MVIVGGDELSYSSAPGDGRSWRDHLLMELAIKLISKGYIFLDVYPMISSRSFIAEVICMCISQAFVLSWSLLELMACGTPVLAESNPMMKELIKPGINGALWQGEPEGLAKQS